MNLDQYLSQPDAMTVSELRARMQQFGYRVKSNAQIRQWRHKYSGRVPNPENCVGLERVTNGVISRRELRENDWHLIWPELAQQKDVIRA
ncbi:transcriptional regulator [Burkholderia stagnalis]|uniref:transcriptional regulator n=1 Tax=Burkholderia stagnalis TaxID=1503054 RepID=UPI00162A4053|nr:YdaS family helix-turn-helix protein [Burkholderia stagnalis]